MNKKNNYPSINFHLWPYCNMKCKFCFAGFEDVKENEDQVNNLSKREGLRLVELIAEYGFEKITFVGGEPTLCPWLSDLIKLAKIKGLTTMIVSNGSRLTDAFLKSHKYILDWITISIDSLNADTNKLIGRSEVKSKCFSEETYLNLINKVKHYGYKLKINTVVNKYNKEEVFNSFIIEVQPERWKIFQALAVQGQNDKYIDQLSVSDFEFNEFVKRHHQNIELNTPVSESNEEMQASYLMIDPIGRFFDNASGKHRYSEPILSVGIEAALNQICFDLDKFLRRGGVYDW